MSRHSTVLIAGGGIAGLALALTCHQIGVPFRVFESVTQIKPLGVGINLQPSAVRELADLGLESALDGIGVRTRDYGMYTQFGLHIWTEPRGLWAGYPLERWTDGRVSLMGDAAHPAYPVGSNGAGSAIIDARKLGRSFIDNGVTPEALQAYESEMRPITTKVILTNRVAGPDQILDVVQERCAGRFERIEDVISSEELAAQAQRYKAIAGYAIASTNDAPSTIPPDRRIA